MSVEKFIKNRLPFHPNHPGKHQERKAIDAAEFEIPIDPRMEDIQRELDERRAFVKRQERIDRYYESEQDPQDIDFVTFNPDQYDGGWAREIEIYNSRRDCEE